MANKELVFKLVMDADVKNFVNNTKQSTETVQKMFDDIKQQSQTASQAADSTSKSVEKVGESAQQASTKTGQLEQSLSKTSDGLKNTTDTANTAQSGLSHVGESAQSSVTGVAALDHSLESANAEIKATASVDANLDKVGQDAQASVSGIKALEQSLETANQEIKGTDAAADQASGAIENIIPKGTKELADSLTLSLTKATQIIDGAGDKAGEAANNFKDFGNKSSKAIDQLNADLVQAKQKLEQFSKTKATPEDIANAQAKVDALEKEVEQANQAFAGFKNSVDKANEELKEIETVSQKLTSELGGLKTSFNAVTGALAALGLGVTAQELAKTADEWASLNARVKISVGAHGDAKQAMADIIDIARSTNSNLTATGDLYSRLTKIGHEMKIPQNEILQLTKTINQAIQVSGGSAEGAEAAITQLQQALASGVLRGDEFNSMMEQSPRLTQALADGLHVTTGRLRVMAGEGKLTTEVVTKALLSQSATIQKEFSQFPATIGGSIENLKTAWTVFIGELDQTHGVSAKVAEALGWVAKNLDEIFNTLTLATQAFIAYKALNIANVFLDKATAVRAASVAITQETAAVVANTQAQLANNTATKAGIGGIAASTASAGGGITALIGRLGALGIAVTALGVLVPTVIEPLGTAIGEGVAKKVEQAQMAWHNFNADASEDKRYMTAIEQLEFQLQNEAAAAKVSAQMKAENARLAQESANKTYGLGKASQDLVTQYNSLTASGKKSAEAIKEISGAMKFDSTQGINNAISALNYLQKTGKASANDIKSTLKDAMSGQDLIVFQTNAKAAFAGTAQEASKNALVIQTAMELALERTGLDTQQLQGKFSQAFQSASNDVQMVVDHLQEYKAQGIDTGLALSANLNKAIDMAQTKKELEYAKNELIDFGNRGLISGDQVTLGLTKIEQKAASLPAALNPVEAVFAKLGIKTQEQLNDATDLAQRNFDLVKNSGQATSEGVRKAYTEWINAAVAAGDKSEIAIAKAKAASLGLNVTIDDTGKATVQTYDEMNRAADKHAIKVSNDVTRAYREMGQVAREEAKDTITAWNDAMAAKSKADAENKTQRIGKDFTTYNLSDVQSKLTSMGYDEAEAAKLAKSIFAQATSVDKSKAMEARQSGGIYGDYYAKAYEDLINKGQTSIFGTQKIEALLAKAMTDTLTASVKNKSVDVNKLAPNVDISTPKTYVNETPKKDITYNLNLNGKQVTVTGDESSQMDMNAFMSELERYAKGM